MKTKNEIYKSLNGLLPENDTLLMVFLDIREILYNIQEILVNNKEQKENEN